MGESGFYKNPSNCSDFGEKGSVVAVQGNNTSLRKNAQELRKSQRATRQEKHLWYDFLREHKPQFHRQVVFGSYIVDFYCPEVKLVIELDGSQHYEPDAMEYDAARTEYLNACGCTVVRYSNLDVDKRFRSVCDDIRRNISDLQRKKSVYNCLNPV